MCYSCRSSLLCACCMPYILQCFKCHAAPSYIPFKNFKISRGMRLVPYMHGLYTLWSVLTLFVVMLMYVILHYIPYLTPVSGVKYGCMT